MADSSEHVDRPLTPLLAALWTMALWLTEGMALELTEAVRTGASHDVVNLGACTVLATSVVLFAMVRVHAREVSLRLTLGVTGIAPLQFVLAAAAGAGLYPILSMVDNRVLERWPYPPDEAAASTGESSDSKPLFMSSALRASMSSRSAFDRTRRVSGSEK